MLTTYSTELLLGEKSPITPILPTSPTSPAIPKIGEKYTYLLLQLLLKVVFKLHQSRSHLVCVHVLHQVWKYK